MAETRRHGSMNTSEKEEWLYYGYVALVRLNELDDDCQISPPFNCEWSQRCTTNTYVALPTPDMFLYGRVKSNRSNCVSGRTRARALEETIAIQAGPPQAPSHRFERSCLDNHHRLQIILNRLYHVEDFPQRL
ncbi:hypothetical protein RB195_010941 [Necator americanus]|uniref:Uncharacterized protein n=1 Tax=Necator americanus TaxID=51031 RepID=A0ABR1D054_NECAM